MCNDNPSTVISFFIIFIYRFISVSSDLWCDHPYECVNLTHNEDIHITAYKGTLATSVSLFYNMWCTGSFSCQSMIIHIPYGNIYCDGTHSCSNTTIVSNGIFDEIRCQGAHSCMFSVIISRDYVVLNCDGYASCAHSHIDSITTIDASGAYALYKAVIDINNNTNWVTKQVIDVYLTGDYAGYGGTIICREQYECHIYCRSYTSCYMLFIDCIGECIVYNETQHTILPITDIDLKTLSNDVGDINIALNNDEDCNTASMSILLDSAYATDTNNDSDIIIYDSDDNEGPICCRGKESCSYIDRIEYESATKGNVICSGYDACSESRIISNNGAVFCEGEGACDRTYIFNASFIYISGSSRYSIITRSRRILCYADQACYGAIIISAGSDLSVYFGGTSSGASEIYCNATDLCDIICGGWRSCDSLKLICDGDCTIQCNEESGCPMGWTASPTAAPTEFTPNPTQYPTLTLTQTSYQYYSSTSSIEAHKKPNNTLIIIVISSISSLTLIGGIIWYLMKRRKKKKNIVDMLKEDERDNNDDDNMTKSDDNNEDDNSDDDKKDNESDLLDEIERKDGEDDKDESIERMYYNETTDYNITQCDDKKDDKTDLLQEIEGIHKTEEAQIDNKDRDNKVNEENKLYAELIRKWLNNMRLEQYLSLFIENGYDSLDYISEITNKNELMDIGIHLKGHQTKIMAQIKLLKKDPLQNEGNVMANDDNDDISDNKWKQVLVEVTAIKNTDDGDSNSDHDDIYVKEKSESVNKQEKHNDYTIRSKEKQTLDYYDKHLIKPHIDNENTYGEVQTKTI